MKIHHVFSRSRLIQSALVAFSLVLVAVPGSTADEDHVRTDPPTIEQFMENDGRVRVIAHRGFSGKAPENTVTAIVEAIKVKADMAEIDVALTADDKVVCLHDEKVNRTTNGRGRVFELTLAEVQSLDAGSWFSPAFKGERIPTLDAVLEAAKHQILVNIEIKPETVEFGIAAKVVEAVKRHAMQDMVLISSFSPEALVQVHTLDPELHTASLYNRKIHRGVDPGKIVSEVSSLMLNINSHYLKREIRERCVELGIPIGVYTANSRRKMVQLVDKGAHAIFTNHPDLLLEVLAENSPQKGSE